MRQYPTLENGKMTSANQRYWPGGTVKLTAMDVTVLNAVQFLYDRDRRVTVNSLIAEVNINRSSLHWHLTYLKRVGLVTWTVGEHGTLRPAVERVFTTAEQSQLADVL